MRGCECSSVSLAGFVSIAGFWNRKAGRFRRVRLTGIFSQRILIAERHCFPGFRFLQLLLIQRASHDSSEIIFPVMPGKESLAAMLFELAVNLRAGSKF
jgi:hypothetical protein